MAARDWSPVSPSISFAFVAWGAGAVQVGANGQASVTHPTGTGTGRDVLCRTRMISDCSTRTVSEYQPGRGEKGKRYMTKNRSHWWDNESWMVTIGFSFLVECLVHSTNADIHSAKLIFDKGRSVNSLSTKTSLPRVLYRC